MRLAYLVTHPIQYQAPLLKRIASEPGIDLEGFPLQRYFNTFVFRSRVSKTATVGCPSLGWLRLRIPSLLGRTDELSFSRPWNFGLARRLSEGRFDALWVHGYMRLFNWSAIASARKRGMMVFLRDEVQEFSRTRGPLRRTAKRPLFRILSRAVSCYFAIGTANLHYYLSLGVDRKQIEMMPYAVDNQFFQTRCRQASGRREHLRSALGLEPGRPIILYAGKLYDRKRPQDLLRAYLQLSKDGRCEPAPYLLFVGEGELRRRLDATARSTGWNSIKFLGFKTRPNSPRSLIYATFLSFLRSWNRGASWSMKL